MSRVARRVEKKFHSKGILLMYHSVGEDCMDPWSLRVTPENFEEHLRVLKQFTHPISLSKFAQDHREGNISKGASVITFDDGYANNLHQAKPLLEKYDIPATVFVATNYVKEAREYWWDDLEQTLLSPGQLPDQLCLKIDNEEHRWDLGPAAEFSEEQAWNDRRQFPWESQPGTRMFLYFSVWQKLQESLPQKRQELLKAVKAWAGDDSTTLRSSHRPMTPEELITFEEGGLMKLGAHTATHPMLANQSLEVQRKEIEQSKVDLENMLNHPVKGFAYPFGNFAPETGALVKEAGFDYACATVQETVWRKSSAYHLPRVEITNFNGEELERRLSEWFKN